MSDFSFKPIRKEGLGLLGYEVFLPRERGGKFLGIITKETKGWAGMVKKDKHYVAVGSGHSREAAAKVLEDMSLSGTPWWTSQTDEANQVTHYTDPECGNASIPFKATDRVELCSECRYRDRYSEIFPCCDCNSKGKDTGRSYFEPAR